jgi:1-acyl-sn-glycerol-3-phosphate acyltransferase
MAFPRPVHYLITRKWYDKSPAWRALFEAFGTEPVRAEDPAATVRAVCDLLSRGAVVGIFPEGSISHTGHLRHFRSGIARIAARSGAPVLPVGIRGAFESMPRHRAVPRPSRVRIHVGEPLAFPGAPFPDDPGADAVRAFRDVVFERIRGLSDQQVEGE